MTVEAWPFVTRCVSTDVTPRCFVAGDVPFSCESRRTLRDARGAAAATSSMLLSMLCSLIGSPPDANGAYDADGAYDLQKLRAQVAVLREDLAAQEKEKVDDFISGFHTLHEVPPSSGGIGWGLTSNEPELCRDGNSSTVFHVAFSRAGASLPSDPFAAVLQAACPAMGETTPLAVDETLALAVGLASGSKTLCATVRVEAFNVALDDTMRTTTDKHTRLAAAQNTTLLKLLGPSGCRRLALSAHLEQQPLPPKCLNVSAPTAGSINSRCRSLHRQLRSRESASGSDGGGGSSGGAGGSGSFVTAAASLALPVSANVWQAERAANAISTRRPVPTVRWLRVLGDSVTYNLLNDRTIADAFSPGVALREVARGKSNGGPPRWIIYRNANATRFMTFESCFDAGADDSSDGNCMASFSTAVAAHKGFPAAPSDLLARIKSLGSPLIYYSLGSHASNIGGDTIAEERYRRGLGAFWAQQPPGSQLVLALETARGLGVPTRFSGRSHGCMGTNLRVEARGLAAARALRTVCTDSERCRVLDLFSLTVPHIFDEGIYRRGDPVHFKLTSSSGGKLHARLRTAMCTTMRTC